MLKNYFKIALRNLVRYKAYSLINICGLAISMAASILILLWVQNEISYDRFHAKSNRLYRITAKAGDFAAAVNPAGMPAGLKKEMPAIQEFVRVSTPNTNLFEFGNRKFEENRVHYVDSTFFDLFSFRLSQGTIKTALMRPDAIVLTRAMAKKYFGNEDPIGKTIKKNNRDYVTVTAVLEDIPTTSHLQFDILLPISSIANTNDDLKTNTWGNFDWYSYLLLTETFVPAPASLQKLQRQMDQIYKKHEPSIQITFQLQPLTKIHLHSNLQVDITGHGNIQYVKIFFVVAIFILVVACINFMNLATARSARRAREVGLRKAIGASRGQLVGQFLGESLVISFLALLLAIGLVVLCLPLFNYVAGKQLSIYFLDGKLWFGFIALALLTGLISGSYPALFLSGFKPVTAFKGSLKSMAGNQLFRHGLVITQFVVSIVLLAGTIVVYQQLTFIKNRDLGFDKENLLYMQMTGDIWGKVDAVKSELAKNALTENFTIISELPTNITSGTVDVV